MTNLNLQHWRLDVDAEGITWAVLDKAGESANSLSRAVMDELAVMLDELERQPPKALISSASRIASSSQRKPFTVSPVSSTTVPIPSGAGMAATKRPKAVSLKVHTSTSMALPSLTRTRPGFGGVVRVELPPGPGSSPP